MPPLLLTVGLLSDRKCADNRNIRISLGRVVDFKVCEGIKQPCVCPFPPCQGTEAAGDAMPPASHIFIGYEETSELGFHSPLEWVKYPSKYTEWKRFCCEIVILKTHWEGGGWGRTRIIGIHTKYGKSSGPRHKCKAMNDFSFHGEIPNTMKIAANIPFTFA